MSEKNESRDWELTCDHCNGSGHIFVERQVAERKTDMQEFKEECEECEGRGFRIAFQDIPGIADYVKWPIPAPSTLARQAHEYGSPADVASRIEKFLAVNVRQDSTTLLLYEAMKALRRPLPAAPGSTSSAPGDAQDERIALDRLADYIADNWPYKKYGLEEICQRLHATWPAAFMPAAPAAGDAQPKFDIEAAAQKLAECMDYPWAHMPEQGRTHMRKYAQAVIDAALAAQVSHKGDAV